MILSRRSDHKQLPAHRATLERVCCSRWKRKYHPGNLLWASDPWGQMNTVQQFVIARDRILHVDLTPSGLQCAMQCDSHWMAWLQLKWLLKYQVDTTGLLVPRNDHFSQKQPTIIASLCQFKTHSEAIRLMKCLFICYWLAQGLPCHY